MSLWQIILLALGVVAIVAVVAGLIVHERDRRKVAYMLDSLEDGELNFKFVGKTRFNRTLNRIRDVVDIYHRQAEQDSWIKLIRVLTHEIMNTVSPISSLSEALSRQLDQPEAEREVDVEAGLRTISSSCRDLLQFTETYRELAGMVQPKRKALLVRELLNEVVGLTATRCAESGVECRCSVADDDILIYADRAQLTRVLVNLITNALQAGATLITLHAENDRSEQTLIRVSNNGEPISTASQEQIFIPFFTTKNGGSGIGLSLSRQIMHAHNGTLDLVRSDPTATEFLLTFK